VIRVPVGVPDLGDAPALGFGLTQVFIGIGRVDAGGFARFRIMDQKPVIVR
jgi:hypothetical protein